LRQQPETGAELALCRWLVGPLPLLPLDVPDLLSGLLYDDAGKTMIPTHATKNRVRYRYYISRPLRGGRSDAPVGSVSPISAADIETVVFKAIRGHIEASRNSSPEMSDRETISAHIEKIEVHSRHLAIHIKTSAVVNQPRYSARE
jgi:hypothetical protein